MTPRRLLRRGALGLVLMLSAALPACDLGPFAPYEPAAGVLEFDYEGVASGHLRIEGLRLGAQFPDGPYAEATVNENHEGNVVSLMLIAFPGPRDRYVRLRLDAPAKPGTYPLGDYDSDCGCARLWGEIPTDAGGSTLPILPGQMTGSLELTEVSRTRIHGTFSGSASGVTIRNGRFDVPVVPET